MLESQSRQHLHQRTVTQNGRKVGTHMASILCLVTYSFRVEVSPDIQEVDITLMSTYRKKLAALQPDFKALEA